MKNAKCQMEGDVSAEGTEMQKAEFKIQKGVEAEESFITKEMVAERICVTPETVRRWASDGCLPSHHFGRRLRFRWSEVEAALMKQN